MTEYFEKTKKLSTEVLRLSRNTILVNLRFMDASLAELEYVATPLFGGIATDGYKLIYDPTVILKCYADERYIINRDHLHLLLHCLYRHNFVNELLNEDVWDLACDITVENIINELNLPSFEANRTTEQGMVISALKKELKALTAEKIYRYYLDKHLPNEKLSRLRKSFLADDHSIWYQNNDGNPTGGSGNSSGDSESAANSESNEDSSNGNNGFNSLSRSQQAERWKSISERMQQDLETFSKSRGDAAGSLMQNLGEVNRERYDYTTFLKKFAVMGEVMKINDDEFDYVFYTYGLKLYKKMPLIEPLEYKDVKRIREFAIVIDTSGSVSGELVQTFINKTYNILKNSESFFSKINLHIIQCDTVVQEAVKITSQNEFDRYIKNMKLHGFGGTDFRPAFDYITELTKNGEFTHLKGVIYFTDGWGRFPEKKPPYDTAFVFISDDNYNPKVPSWAIKLVLDKEDI